MGRISLSDIDLNFDGGTDLAISDTDLTNAGF